VEGAELIAELVRRAGDRIVIMPGGGVTERNLKKLLRVTGAREIHGSASATRDGRMTFRNSRVFLGGQLGPPEYSTKVASLERVRAFRGLADG
jgi:copper homeostasis protein